MDEGDIAWAWHKVFAEIGLIPRGLSVTLSERSPGLGVVLTAFDLTPTCRVHVEIVLGFTTARITVARAAAYRSLVTSWHPTTPPIDVFRHCLGATGVCECLHPREDHRMMKPTHEVRCHTCWACRAYRELG